MQNNNRTAGSGTAAPALVPLNIFDSIQARTPTRTAKATPERIAQLLARVRECPKKSDAPLFNFNEHLPGATSRSTSNIVRAHAVVGDIDHGFNESGFEAGLSELEQSGAQVLAYQTYSHTPEAPRWRVVVFLDEPVAPEDYTECWAGLNDVMGGMLDSNAKDCARISYVPSCPPGEIREVRTLNIGGGA